MRAESMRMKKAAPIVLVVAWVALLTSGLIWYYRLPSEATHAPVNSTDRSAVPTVADNRSELDLKRSIAGRVLDWKSCRPVADAVVVIDPQPITRATTLWKALDVNGAFHEVFGPVGGFYVRVEAPNYIPTERGYFFSAVASDTNTDLGEVLLVELHTVTVRLLGPDGRSLNEWCVNHPELRKRRYEIVGSEQSQWRRWDHEIGSAANGSLELDPERRSETCVMPSLPWPKYLSVCHDSIVDACSRLNETDEAVNLTIPVP